ncbi:MAG: hypothetical protein PHU25_17720 [Deltaproteobacteria bacterium]|nr:hypothetical protein [Deltaproteobacteria bacterium]
MGLLRIVLLIAAALAFAGCISKTRVQSVHGKAYVEKGSIFGTGMLNCDATDGNPECWPVNEVDPQGGGK